MRSTVRCVPWLGVHACGVGDVDRGDVPKAVGGDRGGTIGHRDLEGLGADDGDPLPARPVVVRQHRLHERLLAGGVEVMCAVSRWRRAPPARRSR